MFVRLLLYCLLLSISLVSCRKDQDPEPDPQGFVIPPNFGWETFNSTQINLDGDSGIAPVMLQVVNAQGQVIRKLVVQPGSQQVTLNLSSANGQLFLREGSQNIAPIDPTRSSQNISYGGNGNQGNDSDGDGVNDNQDEFPNDASIAYSVRQPSTGYEFWGFEDLWPYKGDFDVNDLGIATATTFYLNAQNKYVRGQSEVVLHTIGGSLPNGLMMQFVWYNPAQKKYFQFNQNYLDSVAGSWTGRGGAGGPSLDNANNCLKVWDNVFDAQSKYYRNIGPWDSSNNADINNITPDTFRFEFFFGSPVNQSLLTDFFMTKGDKSNGKGTRGAEIHIAGAPATSLASSSLLGSGQDNSGNGTWYVTANNEPWGLRLWSANSFQFHYPKKEISIFDAYPQFSTWVSSGGNQNTSWYDNPDTGKTFNPTY